MKGNAANNILRAISENLPLTDILSEICETCCDPEEHGGPTGAACILLGDSAAKAMLGRASSGLGQEKVTAEDPGLRRSYADLIQLCRESGQLPLVLDDPGAHPLTDALSARAPGTPFATAWVWPLADTDGDYVGLLIRLVPEAAAPDTDQQTALELLGRLAAMAASRSRKRQNPARPTDLLEMVVDNVNQGIALFGKDLALLHYNDTYESLYDFAEGFLRKGLHYSDILRHLIERGEFGNVDADEYIRERMRGMKEGGEWRNLRHRPDGSVISVYRKNLIGGGALVTMTDVTEDLRLSLESQRNARLLESIVANINHGVRVIDAEGRLALWNDRYQEMCGYPDYLMQKGMPYETVLRYLSKKEGLSQEETEALISSRLKVVHSGKVFSTQRTLTSGPTIRIDRVPMPEGGFVATYTDITKLLETESELARKTDLLQTTLDIINQGLLVLDADLKVNLFNDSYLQLLDLNAKEIRIGMDYADILQLLADAGEFDAEPGSPEEIIAARLARARTGETEHYIHHRPKGPILRVYRTPMPGGGLVMSYTEITELKQTEAELVNARDLAEAANRAKTEFLANMSHELRTPLNAIIGFAEIMQSDVFASIQDPRYHDYVDSIKESGTHLLSLINDILDLSRIEIGKAVLDEEVLDLPDTAQSCLMLVRDDAEKRGVSLSAEIPRDFPAFRGDRRRLKQIIINLLQNALKFTASGGTVSLNLEHADGGPVVITIADTGIGMSAEDVPRALERFSQVESGLKRKYEGAGLGLPLAQGMAQMHGGEIEIESAPNEGTTVRVLLPEDRIVSASGPLSRATG